MRRVPSLFDALANLAAFICERVGLGLRTPDLTILRPAPSQHRASPRWWPSWCLVGVGWLIGRLPLAVLFPLGKSLGRIGFRIGGRRRRITETNLRLCFPELDAGQRTALARRVFEAMTLGVLELCVAWMNPRRDLRARMTITGAEHFRAAMAQGRGVVLLGAHFACLDIVSRSLADLGRIDVMYRHNKNPVLDWLQVRGRRHYHRGVIERGDTRAVLRTLKSARALWYAADQDYGPKHSVFAPFFGIEAATITATARFAALNKSPVLLISQHRDYESRHWNIRFSPSLEGFPSGDDRQDAIRINQTLEQEIRKHPEQYLWLHRRFKTRPAGAKGIYA